MDQIKILEIKNCSKSDYIKPKRMSYIQNGVLKHWDLIDSHNSVAILLYHEERDSFVLVKQFRPAIYARSGDGFAYELCAGLVDKNKSLEQIAIEEIEEETGYVVPLDELKKITSFYTAVGVTGGEQTLYFAKLNEKQHKFKGGGIGDEEIEVIYIPRKDAKEFMYNEKIIRTSGLMFSFIWFFDNFPHLR